MAPGKTTQPIGPRLSTIVASAQRAHRLQRGERLVGAAGDHDLLFGADDEVACGQDRLQMRGHRVRLDVALLARAVAGQAPEVGAVVDVERDPAAMLLGEAHREVLRGGGVGAGEMRSGDDDRLGAGDVRLVDVAFVERAVGAIVAIEDQRKGLVVADAEHHERGQARGIGANARRRRRPRARIARG